MKTGNVWYNILFHFNVKWTREVWTTEDASPKFAYLVFRNMHRPNVKSPNYLPNLLGSLDHDGNADSNRSGGKKFHKK